MPVPAEHSTVGNTVFVNLRTDFWLLVSPESVVHAHRGLLGPKHIVVDFFPFDCKVPLPNRFSIVYNTQGDSVTHPCNANRAVAKLTEKLFKFYGNIVVVKHAARETSRIVSITESDVGLVDRIIIRYVITIIPDWEILRLPNQLVR